MKIRRLSEIDLARFVALAGDSPELLEQALRNYNAGAGRWSYEPVRQSTADILGAGTPLLGASAAAPWPSIAGQITRACTRGVDQVRANLEVGKNLFDAARQSKWKAVKLDMGRLPLGFGGSVRYWSDVVVEDEGGPFVPFFDHRRGLGLERLSPRQIVFSMQHLWVRERNPDLAFIRLGIIRFPSETGGRTIRVHFHEESELLAYEVLEQRVRVVYETWARVSEERTRKAAGTGTSGKTALGF